jgi:hypothetical protein
MKMQALTAIALMLSVLFFFLHAVGLRIAWGAKEISLVWLGVAFLVAGVYLIPVVFVALG